MVKSHSTFTIDVEIINKARAARINVSKAAENGIRQELIRIGGEVKTIEELEIEREIKERQEQVKKHEIEMQKAEAAADGKIYVDEKSPPLLDIKKFFRRKGFTPGK